MTKKKFLSKFLLFSILVLAIATCSIMTQVQTEIAAPIAQAEGETSALKTASISPYDLYPTGTEANAPLKIMEGDAEICTIMIDPGLVVVANYSASNSSLRILKNSTVRIIPNESFVIKKIYVQGHSSSMASTSINIDAAQGTKVNYKDLADDEKTILGNPSNSMSVAPFEINGEYAVSEATPYVMTTSMQFYLKTIHVVYERLSYSATVNPKSGSYESLDAGGFNVALAHVGYSDSSGLMVLGGTTIDITHAPGYVIDSVIITYTNPTNLSLSGTPAFTCDKTEEGVLTLTDFPISQTYRIENNPDSSYFITSLTIKYKDHEHIPEEECVFGSDDTYHFKQCTCFKRINEVEHTFGEGEITLEPTHQRKGKAKYTCTVAECGHEKEEPVAPNFADAEVSLDNELRYNGSIQFAVYTVKYKGYEVGMSNYKVVSGVARGKTPGDYTFTIGPKDGSIFEGTKEFTFTIEKGNYDMSAVVFENMTVDYNGTAQSILATNLPAGVTATYENNAQTDVGEYTITAKFTSEADDAQYYNPIADMTATLTINKATYDMSGISMADKTVTYDGNTYSLAIDGTLPDGVTVSYDNNDKTDAGVYTVTASFDGDANNYNPIADMTATLTINKATYDMSGISMANKTVTYDGTAFSIAIEGTLPDGVTVSYDNNDKTDAGEYTVTASFAGDANNYNAIADMTATLTINKATYDMSGISMADKTVTYDGTAFSIAIEGTLPTGVTVSYDNNDKTNAGEYTVVASFEGDAANYNAIADMTATLTIEKATYDMSAVVFEDSTVIYNGTAFSILATNLPTGVTVSYENNAQTVVGEYTITASFAGDINNYNAIADMTATLTINKATYDMSGISMADKTVTYDGNTYSLAIEGTLPDGVTVSYDNNDKTDAGVYTVTANFAGDAINYNAIDSISATLTIEKATYDMSAVVFENSTVIYNGTAFSILATNLPTGVTVSYENNAQTVVGEYTVTASFAGDANNYNAIADMTATLTINKATYDMSAVVFENSTATYNGTAFSILATNLPTGVTVSYENNAQTIVGEYTVIASFEGDANNYNAIADMTATLTINKATYDMSGISMANKTVTYDGTAFSIAIEGTLPDGVTVSYDNNDKTDAGVYTVTASFAGDAINYNAIDSISAILTIEKATYDMSGISMANKTVTYDGNTYSLAIDGTLPDGVTVSYDNNDKTDAGEYTVTASFEGDANNYNAIADMTATLTINKATYDMSGISMADKTVTYDGTAYSLAIEGTLPDGVTVSYENNAQTNAGEYTVVAKFVGSANYNDIAPINATLTIEKATYDMSAISMADKTVIYNGTAFSLAIEGTLPDGVTVSYDNNDKTDAGVYTVTASFAGDAINYNAIDSISAILTIEKATYDMSAISMADKTVTYDGTAYSLAIEGTLPTGVTVSYDNNDKTNVGEYIVVAKFVGSANYNDIAPISATLTINKATYDMSAVVFENSTVIYNGTAFSIAIEGTLPTGVTVSYENNAQTVVGEYTVTASFAGDANNYNAIADMTATLTINKATYDMSGISMANKTVTYDGTAFSIAIEGTLPDGVTVSYENNAQTVVGEYTVTASFAGDANNYNAIADMTATLTIEKATYDMSTVVFENSTVIYNGTAFSIAIEGTLPDDVTVSYDNNAQTVVGEYTVTASFAGDANNYNAIADMTATLTINKATYDMSGISMANKTVTYDGNTYSLAIEGTLPDGVAVSYDNNDKTDAGVYTVTANFEGDANNYNAIADMTATLTIEKATYDMSTVVFEDSTVTYNGTAFSLAIEGTLPDGVTVSYENNAQTVVGEYTVTASFEGDANNYNAIADMTATLTIEKATYDMSAVVFENSTVIYNGTAFSILATNLPTGVTVSYENNAQTVVGEYTVIASFEGDANNYNAIASMSATLTIKAVVVENDVKDVETGKPIAKIEKEDGFAPDTQLDVSPFEEENTNDAVNISKKEEIIGSYELGLQQNGENVQPDGDVVVKMLIPNKLVGREFRIAHVQDGVSLGDMPYEIVDGYAVIQTSQLGEFVFVAEKEGLGAGAIVGIVLGSIFFLLIVLFIVLFILWKKRDLKPLPFLVPAFRAIDNTLFKTKLNTDE